MCGKTSKVRALCEEMVCNRTLSKTLSLAISQNVYLHLRTMIFACDYLRNTWLLITFHILYHTVLKISKRLWYVIGLKMDRSKSCLHVKVKDLFGLREVGVGWGGPCCELLGATQFNRITLVLDSSTSSTFQVAHGILLRLEDERPVRGIILPPKIKL